MIDPRTKLRIVNALWLMVFIAVISGLMILLGVFLKACWTVINID